MNNPKSYSLLEVFNNVSVGFVFEFYSSKEMSFIIKEISKRTGKNIMYTNNIEYLPTYSNAVLVKEYEGEKPRYSFKLAQQNFHSALPLVKTVLEWISMTSECARDNRMKVNLSVDTHHLNTLQSISVMDPAKLILKFDESYVYSRFPNQKNSPYVCSVKNISHVDESTRALSIAKNKGSIIRVPDKDYSGINFKNYTMGILEFNYIGGVDYAEKEREILETLEFYVIKTFQSLNEKNYTREEVDELNELSKNFIENQDNFDNPTSFSKAYPNVSVSANLSTNVQTIKTFWPVIRGELFELVINNGFNKGEFNYDSDTTRCQIRNATISGSSLKNIDLVNSNVTGIMENCKLFECKIHDSRLYRSKLVNNNAVTNSYIRNGVIEETNSLDQCFVENENEMINCSIKRSIIKFAGIGSAANLDESSVVIELKQYAPRIATGVEVEEIRDYRWLSGMNDSPDKGFQNAYVKPKLIVGND